MRGRGVAGACFAIAVAGCGARTELATGSHDAEPADAGSRDAEPADAGSLDAPAPSRDGGHPDAARDASVDAPPDAPMDALRDRPSDSSSDAAIDSAPDAPRDAPAEAPVDSGPDASTCDDAGQVVGGPLQINLETRQSCTLSILDGFHMDVEGFFTTGAGPPHRVLAMDRWGAGHLVAYCDMTTQRELIEQVDLLGYLGQTADPRVAALGYEYLCMPGIDPVQGLPSWITYLGLGLPPQYLGDAAALAADWDVLIVCGQGADWSGDWYDEVERFVTVHGRGLLAVTDYFGDFVEMSVLTEDAGIHFDAVSLPWGPMVVDEPCVPGMPAGQ